MNAYLVDAFTDLPYSGNPAGVVLDADGMSTEERLKFACELRISETAFVSKSGEADYKVEFYTPTMEVDFCGHATIATFLVLARVGRIPVGEGCKVDINQETKAGVLPVSVTKRDGQIFVTMTQRLPQFKPLPTDIPNFLMMLHLPKTDLDDLYPIQMANTGNWHIMVAVRSPEVLNGINVVPEKLKIYMTKHKIATVDVFCAVEPRVYQCRNFGPGVGVPEDPVTGSAAGALGSYLANIGMLDDGVTEFKVRQGDAIGRPGQAYVRIESERGKVKRVQVTGTGVIVFKLSEPGL
ncbi:MAG TPA: PhzF family phenazine biosynthesis protein [Planctomycetota bacterium]|nr:PhzF family phenazine biosynthesis protein [Planctomycetota bacterium]